MRTEKEKISQGDWVTWVGGTGDRVGTSHMSVWFPLHTPVDQQMSLAHAGQGKARVMSRHSLGAPDILLVRLRWKWHARVLCA